MRSIKHRFMSIKKIGLYVLLICLNLFSVGCDASQSQIPAWLGTRLESSLPSIVQPTNSQQKLSETAPPKTIRQLETSLAKLSPKVSIIEPQNDRVFKTTDVNVRLQVENLPLFKDRRWSIGPYLQLIVDNEPYKPIYNLDEPIVLEDLSPGTHTIRVFASRPWQESFKNEEAYARSTFHILTETQNNKPSVDLPLITYNSPTGNYSAEPIMLDFYLANAPLHSVARKNPDDDIQDWRIRITVNGESFILEDWQSIYLKGFKPGKNWVHLELIDDRGKVIENVYNDTVKSIEYNPQNPELTTLDKLVSDRLSVSEVRSIVDPNYIEPVIAEPQVIDSEPIVTETKPSEEIKTEIPPVETETIPEIITSAPEATKPTINLPLKLESQTDAEIQVTTEIPPEELKPQSKLEIEVTPEISQPPEIEVKTTPEIESSGTSNETSETFEFKQTQTNPPKVVIEITQPENEKIDLEVKTIPEAEATETSQKPKFKIRELFNNIWQKIQGQIDRVSQLINNNSN